MMKVRNLVAAIAAMSLIGAPAAAATNPAASLSVAKAQRASTASVQRSDLAGQGFSGIFILVVVAAVAIVILASHDGDDSDSN